MRYFKRLTFFFLSMFMVASAFACTADGTCLTDCPAPPAMNFVARPHCLDASETGTINVNTNIATSWWVAGPESYGGSGTSQSQTRPIGTYTVTWAAVGGYSSPSSQTFTLSNQGETINFTGNYTQNPPAVSLYFSYFYDAVRNFVKNL